MLVWSHADVTTALAPGAPVAVNLDHHVLVAGPSVFNVLIA